MKRKGSKQSTEKPSKRSKVAIQECSLDNLGHLTVNELKEYLEDHQLATSGTKEELVGRVYKHGMLHVCPNYPVKPIQLAKELVATLEEDTDTSVHLRTELECFIQQRAFAPPRDKPVVVMRGVTADEFYDIAKQAKEAPISNWSKAQLNTTIERVREVYCFFMRGAPEALEALEEFITQWCICFGQSCHPKKFRS
jgi:hypothetical protein